MRYKRESRVRDYGAVSRNSIQRDFTRNRRVSTPPKKVEQPPQENSERRVLSVSQTSSYYKLRRFIVNKRIRILRKSDIGGSSFYVEFVYDDDRKALNNEAGWSDGKTEYLLDGVKFK